MLIDTSGFIFFLDQRDARRKGAMLLYRSAPFRLAHNYILVELFALAEIRKNLVQKKPITLLLILLVFGLMKGTLLGQKLETYELLSAIPENEHQRFSNALATYLGFHRAKDWSSVFDMMPRVNTQHPEVTKEQFLANIKRYGKKRVLKFTPETIRSNESIDGQFEILGCAKVKSGLFSSKWQASIYASLENNKWVFSDILFVFQLEARDPLPCSNSKSGSD